MFVFDISNPLTLMLMVMATALLIFLSQELKKSYITGGTLIVYLLMLIMHVAQLMTISEEYRYLVDTFTRCIVIDFMFVSITFFGYLWVDDMEAKKLGKKSLDNSLDWFWKNI